MEWSAGVTVLHIWVVDWSKQRSIERDRGKIWSDYRYRARCFQFALGYRRMGKAFLMEISALDLQTVLRGGPISVSLGITTIYVKKTWEITKARRYLDKRRGKFIRVLNKPAGEMGYFDTGKTNRTIYSLSYIRGHPPHHDPPIDLHFVRQDHPHITSNIELKLNTLLFRRHQASI